MAAQLQTASVKLQTLQMKLPQQHLFLLLLDSSELGPDLICYKCSVEVCKHAAKHISGFAETSVVGAVLITRQRSVDFHRFPDWHQHCCHYRYFRPAQSCSWSAVVACSARSMCHASIPRKDESAASIMHSSLEPLRQMLL